MATPDFKGKSFVAPPKAESNPMNRNLSAAKAAKQDEFYTQYVDIQKEVEAYLEFVAVIRLHSTIAARVGSLLTRRRRPASSRSLASAQRSAFQKATARYRRQASHAFRQ